MFEDIGDRNERMEASVLVKKCSVEFLPDTSTVLLVQKSLQFIKISFCSVKLSGNSSLSSL